MAHDRPLLIDVPERLIGARVVVRAYTDADAQAVHDAVRESVAHIRPGLPWYDTHETLDDTRDFIRGAAARWAARESFDMGVFACGDGRFLGGVGLIVRDWRVPYFEIGYWLRESAEGYGYMGDAVRLLTTYAFEGLEARHIEIRCDARNTRSARVAERQGYVLEGRLRHDMRDPVGDLRDSLVYAMIPADYERAHEAWPRS